MRYWNKRGVKKARCWPSSSSAFSWTETQSRSHKISRKKFFSLKKWLSFPVIALGKTKIIYRICLFFSMIFPFAIVSFCSYCCNLKQPKEFWCQILVFFTFVLTAPFIPRFPIFVNLNFWILQIKIRGKKSFIYHNEVLSCKLTQRHEKMKLLRWSYRWSRNIEFRPQFTSAGVCLLKLLY